MYKPEGLTLQLAEANTWVKSLLGPPSMGMVNGEPLRAPAGKSARATALALSKATEANLRSLKLDDVGRVGAHQVAELMTQEYFRPGTTLEVPHYAATMFPLTLRFLSQEGAVRYRDLEDDHGPHSGLQEKTTYWRFNETQQNIIRQLELLERQLISLIQHSGFAVHKPYETLRLGHFLSATLKLLGR